MRRGLGGVVVVVVVVLAAVWPSPAWAASYSAPLRTAVASISVAAENRTGYQRSLFPLWADADGDGCNTRYEILIAEATVKPTVGGGCKLTGGRWYSYYDNAYHTVVSELDIDHMVPLAEAWDSGARSWTTARRKAYANDLGDPRPLAAVTDTVNQDKGDQDPARWLPPDKAATCRYVQEWVATKIRWKLTVDAAEKSALTRLAASCPNATLTVSYA